MSHSLKHQIEDLRQANIQRAAELFASLLFIFFFGINLLPQLLFEYHYQYQQLTEEPALLKWLPLTLVGLAAFHFLYVLLTNIMRGMKIAQLKKEIVVMGDGCHCGGNCNCGKSSMDDDAELAELEKLVDEAIAEAEKASESKDASKGSKKKTTKKKTAKKSTKKKSA